ncbi:hypothetical protein GJV82_16170 [Cellulosimicrobium sp. BIT-GX5]|uniref:NUDIX hydrolase n=1 Tax=Cellulosimicrobium composti TaxID=2672572 RepID=A0A6N7ZM01_9MICO|nr:hypothetical protein [Cellulosimicrobium composti]MTG90457.1 hypothetical protein [Cellulosimicrobium composti]TWG87376.1 hypothetical protein L603_001000000760 [Cellulosimicrobium cellulans J34]SMF00748.1 Uncharacterized conserved protein [Cellulosimicrobium cellulans J1]
MTWSETAVLALVLAALVAWLLWVAASRLDRLHRKVMASRLALDAQLVRRASAAVDLAVSGELDPASSVLVAEAAHAVLDDDADARRLADQVPGLVAPDGAPPRRLLGGMASSRALAESDLTATLRSALEDADDVADLRAAPVADELLDTLSAAWYRAQLARRFHNEAVAQAQRVRRKWWVRLFHLAGHAPMPATVELDDAAPDALVRPAASAPTPD